MTFWSRWCARLGAVLVALTLSVLVPVAARASGGPGEVVLDAARRRPRGGGFGLLGLLCCIAVVVLVVFLLLRLTRNRRGPR